MKFKIVFLVLLVLLEACGILYIGVWRESFWQSINEHNLNNFIYYISLFSIVAGLLCLISGYYQYLINLLSLNWRTLLTNKAFTSNHKNIEGGSQRVQEDCMTYPLGTLTLSVGLFRSFLTLLIFTWLILNQLPAIYLLFPFMYAIIFTGLGAVIAKPLINLNYMNQVREAAFRANLTITNYIFVFNNNLDLFRKTKHLNYFQYFYNQITVIVPYVMLSSLYFSTKITFGVLMQQASAIAEIIGSLSYLINSFGDINKWLSCRKRLKELDII